MVSVYFASLCPEANNTPTEAGNPMVLVLTVASWDGIPRKTYLQKSLIIMDFPEASTAATRRMVSNWTSAQI